MESDDKLNEEIIKISTMIFEKYPELMKKLGKYKTAVSCLYIKRLDDIHLPTLKQLIKTSLLDLKKYVATNKAANQKNKK